jgi:glycosyltransferase involved in cell wall biosynthesis
MDISVIVPVFNELENLTPLIVEIEEALDPTGKNYEIIAVDDGSNDGSAEMLKKLAGEHPRLRGVFFRKNSGQAAAFDAGFRNASGAIVVTMDADLQNDPKDIPALIEKLESANLDVVSGWRKDRKDGALLRKIPSRIANRMIRRMTGTQVHDLGCSLKVYRKHVTDEMRLYGEMHRFISVLAASQGAKIGEMVVNHRARRAGVSKYGIRRTIKVLLDLMTVSFLRGYSSKPIYVFGTLGMAMFGIGGLLSMYVLWEKYDEGVWVHRNPLFMVAIMFFLMAFQFLGTGILAEVIVRTYFESQDKTAYTIASRSGFDAAPMPAPAPVKRASIDEPRPDTLSASASG